MTEMEITYNIQTIYTYRNENMPEDSTKCTGSPGK